MFRKQQHVDPQELLQQQNGDAALMNCPVPAAEQASDPANEVSLNQMKPGSFYCPFI